MPCTAEVRIWRQRKEEKLVLYASNLALVDIFWGLSRAISWAISWALSWALPWAFSCTLVFRQWTLLWRISNFSWRVSWLQNKCFFDLIEFSWATQWPVSGAFRGPLGKPLGTSPWATLTPCALKSQRFCAVPNLLSSHWGTQPANRIRRHWYNLVLLWNTAKTRSHLYQSQQNASQPNITFTPMQTSNPTYFSWQWVQVRFRLLCMALNYY